MRGIITFCIIIAIVVFGTVEHLTVGLPSVSENILILAFCGFVMCVCVVLAITLRHSLKDIVISLGGGLLLTTFLLVADHMHKLMPLLVDQCSQNEDFMIVVFLCVLYFPLIYGGSLYVYINYYSGLKKDLNLIS